MSRPLTSARRRVLFVCTYNSIRSPMAEGLLNARGDGKWVAESAGIHPSGTDPAVVAVLAEAGIDISRHRSRSVGSCTGRYDLVVFMSPSVREACYALPDAAEYITADIPVPAFSGKDGLDGFRKSRDELKKWIDKNIR
jgi:arsenate reductase